MIIETDYEQCNVEISILHDVGRDSARHLLMMDIDNPGSGMLANTLSTYTAEQTQVYKCDLITRAEYKINVSFFIMTNRAENPFALLQP